MTDIEPAWLLPVIWFYILQLKTDMAKSAAAAQEAEEIITTTLHWGDVSCVKYSTGWPSRANLKHIN